MEHKDSSTTSGMRLAVAADLRWLPGTSVTITIMTDSQSVLPKKKRIYMA